MKKTICPFCSHDKIDVLEKCVDGTDILKCKSCKEIYIEENEFNSKQPKRKKRNFDDDEHDY